MANSSRSCRVSTRSSCSTSVLASPARSHDSLASDASAERLMRGEAATSAHFVDRTLALRGDSRRRVETYCRTIQFDTSAASCSSSNRSKIRVAVCRCSAARRDHRAASRQSPAGTDPAGVPASVVASWSSSTPTPARQRPCGTRPGASAAVLGRQPGTGVAPYRRIELDAGARGRQWSSPLLLVWVVEPEDLGEVRGVRHRARSGPGAINGHEPGGSRYAPADRPSALRAARKRVGESDRAAGHCPRGR